MVTGFITSQTACPFETSDSLITTLRLSTFLLFSQTVPNRSESKDSFSILVFFCIVVKSVSHLHITYHTTHRHTSTVVPVNREKHRSFRVFVLFVCFLLEPFFFFFSRSYSTFWFHSPNTVSKDWCFAYFDKIWFLVTVTTMICYLLVEILRYITHHRNWRFYTMTVANS